MLLARGFAAAIESAGREIAIRTRLNLASSPLENHRRFFAATLAIGLPAIVLGVVLCFKVVGDRASTRERRIEVQRLETDMADLRAQRAGLEQFFSDPSTRLVTQRAAFLNSIIDERSFPWTQFFLDLEHRLPGGVRILSISPSLSGDRVKVRMHVGALSDKSKLDFLKALEDAPEFSALELVSETRPAKGEDANVAELDLTADYRAGPYPKDPEQSARRPARDLQPARAELPTPVRGASSRRLDPLAVPLSQSVRGIATPQPVPDAPTPAFKLPSISPGRALEESFRGALNRGGNSRATFSGAIPRGGTGGPTGRGGGAGDGYLGGAIQMLTPDQGVDFSPYLNGVVDRVRREWYSAMPESARMGDRGRVVIDFKIMRDGTVVRPDPLLRLTSGKDPLDSAALGSIRGASPFPPLPSAFSGPYVELRFLFLYNLPMESPQ